MATRNVRKSGPRFIGLPSTGRGWALVNKGKGVFSDALRQMPDTTVRE